MTNNTRRGLKNALGLKEQLKTTGAEVRESWAETGAEIKASMTPEAEFYIREAEKYEAKAAEREARGDLKGAARSRKVAESNRSKAAKQG